MRAKLKPLADQVIVITGASSGIGLAAARQAAEAGAAVVLVGRNETALREACEEINAAGGRAHPVAGDVGDAEDAAKAARAAIARFGGFDIWINGAGLGPHVDAKAVKAEDHERLFRASYFGLVNGSLEAARTLRARQGGGVIVNLDASPSKDAGVLALPYSYSRRAVKRFSASLAGALRREGAPIDVVVVRAGDNEKRTAQALLRAVSPAATPTIAATAALGFGALALAGTALWFGRDRIAGVARPLVGRAVRPLVIGAARRRPLTAVKLVARHPRQALKLASALR